MAEWHLEEHTDIQESKAPKDGNNYLLKAKNIGEQKVLDQNQEKERSLDLLSQVKRSEEKPAKQVLIAH